MKLRLPGYLPETALLGAALVLHLAGFVSKVASQSNLPVLASGTVNVLLLAIAVLLIIGFAGVAVKRAIVSLLSLTIVIILYIFWFVVTLPDRALLKNDPFYAEHPEAAISHTFGLAEGRWWNIAVLGLIIFLMVPLTVKVRRSLRR